LNHLPRSHAKTFEKKITAFEKIFTSKREKKKCTKIRVVMKIGAQ